MHRLVDETSSHQYDQAVNRQSFCINTVLLAMPFTLPFITLLVITLLFSFVIAQQYAGQSTNLPRLPPTITGGELAFFNIKDTNGGNVTMANYFSLPNGQRQVTHKVCVVL